MNVGDTQTGGCDFNKTTRLTAAMLMAGALSVMVDPLEAKEVLRSPDGSIEVNFLSAAGKFSDAVNLNGEAIIPASSRRAAAITRGFVHNPNALRRSTTPSSSQIIFP